MDIFAAHVRTLLRENGVVDALLDNIASAPTAARIDDIDITLNSEQQSASEHAQKYRLYLLVFAAALIGLFAYAALHLIRSHAVIRGVNAQLQHANDHLEQRVQQRTDELTKAQAELVTTARQAGMAEIANNVLHDIGNVLNSVNVSADLLTCQVRASRAAGLGDVVELINAHAGKLGDFLTVDEKGKILPAYLSKLAQVVAAEQKGMLEELAQLTKSVDHIKDIVAAQQSCAGTSSMFAQVRISSLLEDAVCMSATSLSHHRVTVIKEFADLPPLLLDKHRVLQILINLIGNAAHATDGMPDRQARIVLRLLKTPADAVQIQVEDNGEGIPPENLARIFTHGFTTRASGHGFGLHSCILAAAEMGGSLKAYSDGRGKGATFTLELPMPVKAP